jgi:threonine synthase
VKFSSTRGRCAPVDFRDAVFKGLAEDGGLYHPVTMPDLREVFRGLDPEAPFVETARRVAIALFADDLGGEGVERVVRRAFGFEPVLVQVDERRFVLELFHGPSYAFKDFGAGFLSAAMEEMLARRGGEAVILVATSGDTGSAVARAFVGRRGIRVVILYPSGRVSPLQEMQLTTVGGNVTALEVKGSFDDCQRMVKEAFLDKELSRAFPLTSANSISLGRLLPQAFYYIHAAARLRRMSPGLTAPWFCVPSGNFGNLTAGVYAWRWGLPVAGFVAATNANDVVPQYLAGGVFRPRASVQTLSNAMDVGNPSNFERLSAVFGGSARDMNEMIRGAVVTDAETLATIREVQATHGLLLDPHTAVGWKAATRLIESGGNGPGGPFFGSVVTLATAHPAKFLETIREATGREPALPPGLAEALKGTKRSVVVEPTLGDLRKALAALPAS